MFKQIVSGLLLASAATAAVAGDGPSHHDFEKLDKMAKRAQIVCGATGAIPVAGAQTCVGLVVELTKAGYADRINDEFGKKDLFKDMKVMTGIASGILQSPMSMVQGTLSIDNMRKTIRNQWGLRFDNGNLIQWDPSAIDMDWERTTTNPEKATDQMKQMMLKGLVKIVK